MSIDKHTTSSKRGNYSCAIYHTTSTPHCDSCVCLHSSSMPTSQELQITRRHITSICYFERMITMYHAYKYSIRTYVYICKEHDDNNQNMTMVSTSLYANLVINIVNRAQKEMMTTLVIVISRRACIKTQNDDVRQRSFDKITQDV